MTIIGIDISKLTFDAHIQHANRRFQYTKVGIETFIKDIHDESHCVMESTGPYSYRLAEALSLAGKKVSIVNGLCIKRFAQMNLSRAKTDSCDAKLITLYAKQSELREFVPLSDEKNQLKQRITALEALKSQRTNTTNVLESLNVLPRKSEDTCAILQNLLQTLNKLIKELSGKIDKETRTAFGKTGEAILTIPGVGIGTVSHLLVLTNGLENFKNSSSLAAFIGICPRVIQSGTSVRGRGSISRLGHGSIRAKLYMCALTAMKNNKACKEIYDRLVAKGKPKKVALVAVGHKLIKQIFAIAKKGEPYNENFLLST